MNGIWEFKNVQNKKQHNIATAAEVAPYKKSPSTGEELCTVHNPA